MRRAAERAELASLEVLERAGQPYPHDASSTPVRPARVAVVGGALLLLVFYDLSYGALTLALHDRVLTIGDAVGRGAIFAVLMVSFNLTLGRRRNERNAGRSTAGQRGA